MSLRHADTSIESWRIFFPCPVNCWASTMQQMSLTKVIWNWYHQPCYCNIHWVLVTVMRNYVIPYPKSKSASDNVWYWLCLNENESHHYSCYTLKNQQSQHLIAVTQFCLTPQQSHLSKRDSMVWGVLQVPNSPLLIKYENPCTVAVPQPLGDSSTYPMRKAGYILRNGIRLLDIRLRSS